VPLKLNFSITTGNHISKRMQEILLAAFTFSIYMAS